MFQIVNVDESNYRNAYDFLKSVPSISAVEDAILKNGVLVVDSDRVIGSVSFEVYDRVGLIRYFVFKKSLANTMLDKLMRQLEDNAKKIGLIKLVCVADNNQIEELFKELCFEKLNRRIFINEEIITQTNYSNSNFLYKII